MSDYIEELRKPMGTRPIIMCRANVIVIDGDGKYCFITRKV